MTIALMTAKVPGKNRMNYRKLALVELADGFAGRPAMISNRARGVVKVIEEHTVHVGKTDKSAGYQLMLELKARADVVYR